jgi:NADH dehydrogenase [ubiquinone] 1 alpha subcomplex assembly factor 5
MFNTSRIEHNRIKSRNILDESPFHKFICADMIDRLAPIDRNFNKILLINPILKNFFAKTLTVKYPEHKLTIVEQLKQLDNVKQKFDLIIFPFGLHWVSNVQKLLKQIYDMLDTAGVFICNFSGGGTLSILRRKLIDLESKTSGVHVPHISPFIQFEHMTPLLTQAGFAENIIDIEPLTLEYESPLSLMKALKLAGESNSIENGVFYSITKNMYQELAVLKDQPFIDRVNLISFISSKTKRNIKLLKEHFQN